MEYGRAINITFDSQYGYHGCEEICCEKENGESEELRTEEEIGIRKWICIV